MVRSKFLHVVILGICMIGSHVRCLNAEDLPRPDSIIRNSFGLGASFHKQITLSPAQSSGTTLLLLHPQLATFLNPRFTIIQEGVFGYSLTPRMNSVIGFSELLRFTLAPKNRFRPFVDIGPGISAFSLRLPELGRKMEFILQAGVGIRYDIKSRPGWNWVLMYKPTHFSDAGTKRPNQGINLHTVFVGITLPF